MKSSRGSLRFSIIVLASSQECLTKSVVISCVTCCSCSLKIIISPTTHVRGLGSCVEIHVSGGGTWLLNFVVWWWGAFPLEHVHYF